MKRNLLVFDIDGTLSDSVSLHQKAFTEILLSIGVQKINSEFKTFKHHTDSFIMKEIYETHLKRPLALETFNEFENGLTNKISQKNIKEIEGAKKLIARLEHKTDFGICYATGSLRRPAEHKLKSIGINFNEIQLVASDTIFEREHIVQTAIKNAKEFYKVEKFNRIISVGDGLWDLITAKNLGLEFIGIGLANKKILLENGAKIVYENLVEFDLNNSTT